MWIELVWVLELATLCSSLVLSLVNLIPQRWMYCITNFLRAGDAMGW